MKRYLALFVVLFATVLFSFAEDDAPQPGGPGGPEGKHHGPGEMIKHRLEHLSKDLNLTPDQITKAKAIFQAELKEAKPIHDDTTLDPQQKHQEMKAVREKYATQFEAILTPEQLAKFKQIKAEHEKEWKHKDPKDPSAPAPTPAAN
jgi:Spy/CpxP family protein refolding chaperone